MKQSNIYHKADLSFGGILQPMIESLERSPRRPKQLIGQDIVMHNKSDIKAIIAIDSDDNIHLLLSPPSGDDFRFSKFDLKGLKIAEVEWSVANRNNQLYLDISCSTGIMPSFKRPFLRLAEDVLFEISRMDISPSDAVYTTCLRWKKFWTPEIGTEVTKEWVYGLFGELIFLSDMIKRFGPKVLDTWMGPLAKDHDFQKGAELAAEIKTSTETPFSIICNIRQLDSNLFKRLFIVCYKLSLSENGRTLPEIVRVIENLLSSNEDYLDKFYEKLTVAGYQRHSEPFYNELRLHNEDAVAYEVNEDFPKIVEKSFAQPPDHRITGIKYNLQLIGLEELTIEELVDEFIIFSQS